MTAAHCEIAHAEVNAQLELDNRVHDQVNDYTLYVSLEPCPVCFGAFYMSGIRNLKFAAKDSFGGSTNLFGKTPYLNQKPIRIEGPVDNLGRLSIFMNVYCDHAMGRDSGGIHQNLRSTIRTSGKWQHRLARGIVSGSSGTAILETS